MLTGGEAKASFVMDHARFGPQGVLGGEDGRPGRIRVLFRDGGLHIPPHLSKDQGIPVAAGDAIAITTPGGGGYGDPRRRDPALVARDLERGYYTEEEIGERFGVRPVAPNP
jgi:N-methylhydantoinase B